jgi:predicted DNA-binding transcriptional regulator AlpA
MAKRKPSSTAAAVEPDRIVTEKEICSAGRRRGLLPFDRSTLWQMCDTGEFPKPIQLSRARKGWRLSRVWAWIAERERKPIKPRDYFGRSSEQP